MVKLSSWLWYNTSVSKFNGGLELEDYKVVKLRKNCIKEFKFVAKIHDYIFANDKDHYVANYSKIDRGVKQLANSGLGSHNVCYVAIHNKEIIGFVWLKKIHDDTMIIESMWTLEEFRHQGIATTLCKYASVNEGSKLRRMSLSVNENINDEIKSIIHEKIDSVKEEVYYQLYS